MDWYCISKILIQDKKYLIDGFPRNLENMNSWEDKMSQFVDGKGIINIQCEEVINIL